MTVVKLFKIDKSEQTLAAVFDDGDHFIGRGTYLSDRRISRKHGLLKVTKDTITLTAVHENPCYYKTENGCVTMLEKGESITLRNKDMFSCLKEGDSWLQVVISEKSQCAGDTTSASTNLCNKRKNSFDTPGTSCKITKTDVANETNGTEPGNVLLDKIKEEPVMDYNVSGANTLISILSVKTEVDQIETANSCVNAVAAMSVKTGEIKQETESTICCANGEIKVENEEQSSELPSPTTGDGKNNTAPAGKDAAVGVRNTKKTKREWRDRCWYGKSCFRKSQEHKASFSHPADSDYDTDPGDDRPSCSYGSACYRRNPVHRRQYKHPSNGGPRPKPKRPRTKPTANNQTPTTAGDYDDAEDDYDLQDPFINDDSEDDFQPEDDDDTDSDWDDSQEINEDDDTKQLLKEAKRITRNKGKN